MGIKITEINIIGLFLFVLFGMEVFLSISFITAFCQHLLFPPLESGWYAGRKSNLWQNR